MKTAEIERERTFLIRALPDLKKLKKAKVEQHYITEPPNPFRIRKIGGRYELTRKKPVGPARWAEGGTKDRQEENSDLNKKEFEAFRKKMSLRHLTKVRHYLPLGGGLVAEIDVFGGKLKGLVWVEVEFRTEARNGKCFVPPPWFGREVTSESWASNSWLAGKSFKQIRPLLDKK